VSSRKSLLLEDAERIYIFICHVYNI
jgi:hypothetical protein